MKKRKEKATTAKELERLFIGGEYRKLLLKIKSIFSKSFKGAKNDMNEGWKIFKDSIHFLFKKPIFIIPIFLSWIIVSSVVLYHRYYFDFPSNFILGIFYIYVMIVIIALTISIANIVMLEIIQQIESGKKISFSKVLKEAFVYDLVKVIPMALIWGIVWLIIVILRAFTERSREDGEDKPKPSMADAAQTLSGMNRPTSLFTLSLDMLEKLVRMVVFLALPAITWEHKGPISSFKKSFQIVKKHPTQFLMSYTLTLLAAGVMVLPLLPIYISWRIGIDLSPIVWTIVLIYVGLIWTLEIYLEQMSVGLLYLWHLKWVKKGSKGKLSSVKKPDLFDDIYELKHLAERK